MNMGKLKPRGINGAPVSMSKSNRLLFEVTTPVLQKPGMGLGPASRGRFHSIIEGTNAKKIMIADGSMIPVATVVKASAVNT